MDKKVVDIADALGQCLEEIEAGRLTVEECLERYPDYAADLQELLKTQQKLQHTPVIQPATWPVDFMAARHMWYQLGFKCRISWSKKQTQSLTSSINRL